ncbi:hypothetical protein FA13DRAFT_1799261 [Coprinellus micaceus]|uniref:Uncharacterized protein n=1 Tax=Coprinellus micaceus TaxID=71717 RepID=A0A4Y7SJK9_COPMI|nr:hypothetical protein FA13DRAFT_1799261 [Coprinellus micaceus]
MAALRKAQDHLDAYFASSAPSPPSSVTPPSSPSTSMDTPPSSPARAMATTPFLPPGPPMAIDVDPPATVFLPDPLTLHEFVVRAMELHGEKRFSEFAHFVLSGIHEGKMTLLIQESLREDPFVYVYRFLARIVGISKSIDIIDTLKLNAQCSWAHSIREESQVNWTWESDGETYTESLSNIPNVLLGTFGDKSSIHILLPSLFDPDSPTFRVEVAQLRQLWDCAITPALASAIIDPLKMEVPWPCVSDFAAAIVKFANQNIPDIGDNLRFVHIVDPRPSFHDANDASQEAAFESHFRENMLAYSPLDDSPGGMWFVDIGLQVQHQNKSVAWGSSSHEGMVRALIGRDDFVLDVDSPNYQKTFFSHMSEVACARIVVDGNDYEDRIVVRLSVDDSPMQVVDERGDAVNRVTALDLIRRPASQKSFLQRLSTMFINNVDTKDEVIALATLTVPIQHRHRFIPRSADLAVFASCVTFATRDLWFFRSIRAQAMRIAFDLQRAFPRALSARVDEGLSLTASLAWMVNALHLAESRDIELPNGHLVLPATMDRGVLFLEPMHLPDFTHNEVDVPYFIHLSPHGVGGFLDRDQVIRFLGDFPTAIISAFTEPNAAIPPRAPSRPAPNGPRPFRISMPYLSSISPAIYAAPRFEDKGLALLSHGPVPTSDPSIAKLCNELIALFIKDVMTSAPHGTVRPIALTRTSADKEIFAVVNLANISSVIRWKHSKKSEWERAFFRFFPDATSVHYGPHSVGYTQCSYYRRWLQLPRELGDYSFNVLRRGIWATFFQHAYWLPNCQIDGIWTSSWSRSFAPLHPMPRDARSIHLLINGAVDPVYEPNAVIF